MFCHETDTVIAPSGVKQAGSIKQADEKAGCTVVVTIDLSHSKLLKPFLILNGKAGATLDTAPAHVLAQGCNPFFRFGGRENFNQNFLHCSWSEELAKATVTRSQI